MNNTSRKAASTLKRQQGPGSGSSLSGMDLHAEILENMEDGVSIQDRDLRVIYGNAALKKLFGEDLEGRYCYQVYQRRPQACPDCPVMESFRAGETVRGTYQGVDRHGGMLTAEIAATPLRDGSGEIVAGMEVVRIVTEQVKACQGLLEKNRRLERLAAVAREIASGLDLERVLEQVVVNGCELAGAAGGIVALNDEKNHRIVYPCSRGVPTDLSRLSFPPGSGLAGQVMQTGEPLVLDSYADYADNREIFSGDEPQSAIAVPIKIGRKAAGALLLFSRKREKKFSPEDLRVVTAVAGQAAVAIENARLFEETNERLRVRRELSRVAVSIAAGLDLEATLTKVAQHAARVLKADAAMVAMLDEEEGRITFPYAYRLPEELTRVWTSLGDGLADSVIRNRSPRIVNDYQLFSKRRPQFARAGVTAIASVPLIIGDRCVGAIGVMDLGSGQQFVRDDIDILSIISTQAAVAVENAQLYDKLNRSARELESRVSERTEALSRLYKESERKGRELKKVDRLKSEFLANMSHELRTPLNAILGFTKLILDRIDGDINLEQQRDLEIVHGNGMELLRLIDGLLDLARIEAGRLRVSMAEEDPGELASEVVLGLRPRAEALGLQLDCRPAADLSPISLDRRMTGQTLMNLVGNAIKFSGEGVITVTVEQTETETVFSIADTGPGIKEDQLKAVFDRFHQIKGDLVDAGGVGLGLTLSKRFVELQGGRIWVESEFGKGSTFFFSLVND